MKLYKSGKIEESVTSFTKPIIEAEGLSLWDVRFEKEGAAFYLRIFIDKPTGVTMEDCEKVTKPINDIVDQQDYIDKIDIVEIGSPGLERPLRRESHFINSVEKPVIIKLYQAMDGEKQLTGILSSFDEEEISLTCGGQVKKIKISDIAKINLNDLEDI